MAERKKKNRQMFSWMNPKLEVREIKNIGKGVFVKREIKKDEMLAVFGGYIISVENEANLSEEYNDCGVQISEDFVLSSGNKKEETDYFNHSCDPNAGFHGQIFLVAMKKIKKDEEVVFDYAMVLHKVKNVKAYNMKCLCGSEKCRKYITENDWKISELQKKYNGYFQYFLQNKINKLKK
ncbi:MAG: SET domain-containing protein [Candidatus Moraniibacteriota bacterium]